MDYNTEFSGITKEALCAVTTTLDTVHLVLRQLIGPETIIVGHSLDSDLKVLRLVHLRVIDTAALYPHTKGAPFKRSLKHLARDVLGRDIQEGTGGSLAVNCCVIDFNCCVCAAGHDSVQDSAISLELAFLKARRGSAVGALLPWSESTAPRCTLFQKVHEALFLESEVARQYSVAAVLCLMVCTGW